MAIEFSRLSKKALRRASLLIAKTTCGGSIVDSEESFYAELIRKTGYSREEAEKVYTEHVARALDQLTNDMAFRKKYEGVFGYIGKQIGRKLYKLTGKEAPPPIRAHEKKPEKEKVTEVKKLMRLLLSSKDQDEKRRLRRKLRRYGHTGGLRKED